MRLGRGTENEKFVYITTRKGQKIKTHENETETQSRKWRQNFNRVTYTALLSLATFLILFCSRFTIRLLVKWRRFMHEQWHFRGGIRVGHIVCSYHNCCYSLRMATTRIGQKRQTKNLISCRGWLRKSVVCRDKFVVVEHRTSVTFS